jgi:hypothetical protein
VQKPGPIGVETKAIQKSERSGTPWEVLLAFAKLGVSCFGGPTAGHAVELLKANEAAS